MLEPLESYLMAAYGSCGPHEHACHHRLVSALHDSGAMLVVNGIPADSHAPQLSELRGLDWYLDDLCFVGSPCWWHPDAHGAPHDGMLVAYIILNPEGARIVGMEVDKVTEPCSSCSWGIPHMSMNIMGYVTLNRKQVLPSRNRKPKIDVERLWNRTKEFETED